MALTLQRLLLQRYIPQVASSQALYSTKNSSESVTEHSHQHPNRPRRRHPFESWFEAPIDLENEINRFMNSPFDHFRLSNQRNKMFQPQVDIVEKENSYEIIADLPGMNKSDVKVQMEDDIVKISGQREDKHVEEGANMNFKRIERSFGAFSRQIRLPQVVSKENVSATFENGVLKLVLKKEDKQRPIDVEIQ
jgi:HSP20 family protein